MTTTLCTVFEEVRTDDFFFGFAEDNKRHDEAGTSPFEHLEDLVETPSLTTAWPPPRHRHEPKLQNEPTPPLGARSASARHVWHTLVLDSGASEAVAAKSWLLAGAW
jgi:hypothetical protein